MATDNKHIKRVASGDAICSTSIDKDSEKIFTSAVLLPLCITAAYLVFLRQIAQALKDTIDSKLPYSDPFKRVWWSGPIFFTIAYLAMIYFGTRYMKDRKEFQIKPYIFTYNLYQCILNLWCVGAMIHEVYTNPVYKAPWGNSPTHTAVDFKIGFLVWLHYNNKYSELLDTVWMVMRKKNNQVSFLHCYHHILLIWAWFFVCKIEVGGDVYFGACVNSFIHVIMYGYYTLALLNIPCPWKQWITNCQMVQFMACLIHSSYVLWKKNVRVELPLMQGFVMINMLVLFGNFYRKSYLNKKTSKKIE